MCHVQESQPRSGLLQSSLVTLYTMYLTWSAMTNEPGKKTKAFQLAVFCSVYWYVPITDPQTQA